MKYLLSALVGIMATFSASVSAQELPTVQTNLGNFYSTFGGDTHYFHREFEGGLYSWKSTSTNECMSLKGRPPIEIIQPGFGLQYTDCDPASTVLWRIMILKNMKSYSINLTDTNLCVSIDFDMIECTHNDAARIPLPKELVIYGK